MDAKRLCGKNMKKFIKQLIKSLTRNRREVVDMAAKKKPDPEQDKKIKLMPKGKKHAPKKKK